MLANTCMLYSLFAIAGIKIVPIVQQTQKYDGAYHSGPSSGHLQKSLQSFIELLTIQTKIIIVIIVPTSVSSLFEPQSIDFHPWGKIRESVPSLKNDCFEKNQSNCGGATCPTRSKLDQNTLFQKSHPLFSSKIVDCWGTDKNKNSNLNCLFGAMSTSRMCFLLFAIFGSSVSVQYCAQLCSYQKFFTKQNCFLTQ